MTAPYLSLESVRMDFAVGAKPYCAVRDIDLAIDKGEVVSIIGHSGCGKSTLLNIVAGLLRCSEGVVILDGKEVDSPGPDRGSTFTITLPGLLEAEAESDGAPEAARA